MKAKYLYLTTAIFFGCLWHAPLTSQNTTPIFSTPTPPSPDAAALGKYGQYPVSLYNGLVQIDIPIHTIEMPLCKLPISISYHASGIKVDEISSSVGLGWALNAGGVITRSVRGMPDENFGLNTQIDGKQWVINNFNWQNNDLKNNYLFLRFKWDQTGAQDTESDIYYYNVCGLSGSFRKNKNGQIIQIPLTNNKIEVLANDIFQITGSDGTIYHFADKEIGKHFYGPMRSSIEYTSSWYLSEIITTDKRNINFEYMDDNTSYMEHYPVFSLWIHITSVYPTGFDNSTLNRSADIVETKKTLLIKKITFPDGYVFFNYTGDRADRRKYRLTGIDIKDKSKLVKAYSLEQGYFTRNGVALPGVLQSSGSYSSNYDNRLKLDKLILLDNSRYPVSNYSFEYNSSVLLPPYYNYSSMISSTSAHDYYGQDEWGYYNGIKTNKSLFIYEKVRSYTMPSGFKAERSINTSATQACILKKIGYPAGGYTEFEYEGNKVLTQGNIPELNTGGLRIKSVKSYSSGSSNPVVNSYQYENGTDNKVGWTKAIGSVYTQAIQEGNNMEAYDFYSSQPILPLSHSGGASAFYKKVTVYEGSPENSNGKTEHLFLYSLNDVEYFSQYPCVLPKTSGGYEFLPCFEYLFIDRAWTRGYPFSTKIYKKENGTFSVVKNTVYSYTTFEKKSEIVGFKSFANFNNLAASNYNSLTTPIPINYPFNHIVDPNEMYQYTDIIAETGLVKLTQIKDTTFFNGSYVAQLTTNHYDKLNNQYEISATYTQRSDGSTLKQRFKYPKDMNVAPYTSMANLNMLSQVIVTTDSLDNKFLQENQTAYSYWNNSFYAPSATTVRIGTGSPETRITYNKYDSKGNVSYITKDNADNIVYLWGYNYQYPIAEIKGVAYSDVTAKISESSLNTIAAKNEPTTTDMNTINGLRSSLPKALITTYTYAPLVGILTMTDPRNVVTNYEYDTFGRLKKVTQAGRVIESYYYNYKQ